MEGTSMRSILLRRGFLLAALLAGMVLVGSVMAADDDKDFKALFNGKDFTGLKAVIGGKEAEPTKSFTVKEGIIVTSGNPQGYFVTDKGYKNYVLRFEWKYARPKDLKDDKEFKGNSGCLVHIQGLPEKGNWPKSVEVQGMNRDMGNIFAIGGAAKGDFKKDADTQAKAIKPVGEWNSMEIISKDGMLTCTINGKKVAEGKSMLMEGPIGWQAEGAEIHFRNLKIKEMK
jgi:hypothetical protein